MAADLWLQIALAELADHVVEDSRPGKDNPRIIEYDSFTTLGAKVDEVPWCSAFACWVMEHAGIPSTRNAMARSWLNWDAGDVMQLPRFGAITILRRGNPGSNQGHVGFLVSTGATRVALLAGNQGNAVSVAWFDADRVLGFRWPKGVA